MCPEILIEVIVSARKGYHAGWPCIPPAVVRGQSDSIAKVPVQAS